MLAGVKIREVWSLVGSEEAIPESEVLAVVAGEVQMVLRMVGTRIKKTIARNEDTIMNGDCPAIHEHEQEQIHELVHREEKYESVVGRALCESVQWVESMACPAAETTAHRARA
jgi:hypothetical protein